MRESYPYLGVARAHGADYGMVLWFADYCERARVAPYVDLGQHPGWIAATEYMVGRPEVRAAVYSALGREMEARNV